MIIDEKTDAEILLENKAQIFTSDFFSNIYLLSKYWNTVGMYKKQILDNVYELFEHINKKDKKKFNKVKLADSIESIVNNVVKRDRTLLMVDKIVFTDNEVKTILELKKGLQKLAFVILYQAKLTKAKYGKDIVWLNDNVNAYSNQALVKQSKFNKYKMMGELCDLGLLKLSDSVREYLYRVDYIQDGDIAFEINDLKDDSELIFYYFKYITKEKKIKECQHCGRLMRATGKQKYCKPCAKAINIAKTNKKFATH